MTRLRPVLALLLSLILMLGSVTSAVARHDMAGMTAVVLCGTDGAATVLRVDASGQPRLPAHDCPHCLAAPVLGVLTAAPVTPRLALRGAGLVLPARATALPPAQTLCPTARGPPPLA